MFVFRYLFAFLAPHDCLQCSREGSLLCADCLPSALESPRLPVVEGISNVWAAGYYGGLLQELLHYYKFERAQNTADILAATMHQAAPVLPRHTVVTYIPTSSDRVRQRGYDQSKLLAEAFASMRGLTCLPLLRRHGHARQVGANRSVRRRQLQDAYSLRRPELIREAHILLVDDVLTTGASLELAAKILRQSGCRQVDGLVVAYKK